MECVGEKKIGNFYEDMVRITTRILIPASFIVGLLLVSQGTPQTLQGNFTIETLEGNFQDIAVGPVAALEYIWERMVVDSLEQTQLRRLKTLR